MHGGAVSASGQGPGHGTELVVRLPLLGVTSTSFGVPTSESKRPPVVSPRRILVADDNSDAVEALALQLQLAGHDVRTANDGKRSRSRSRLRPRWSCSILACPEWTATRPHARSGTKWWGRSATLVALTGWGQQQDRQRTSAAGFDVHLVKPVTEFDLFHAIASARAGQSTSPGPPSSNSRNRVDPDPFLRVRLESLHTWTDSWASCEPLSSFLFALVEIIVAGCAGEEGAAASGASGKRKRRSGRRSGAVPVAVGTVVRKSMPIEISVIGSAEPMSSVAIRAQTTGQLTSVKLHRGR